MLHCTREFGYRGQDHEAGNCCLKGQRTMNTRCSCTSPFSSASMFASSTVTRVSTFEVIKSIAEATLPSVTLLLASPMLVARSDKMSWRILSSKLTDIESGLYRTTLRVDLPVHSVTMSPAVWYTLGVLYEYSAGRLICLVTVKPVIYISVRYPSGMNESNSKV